MNMWSLSGVCISHRFSSFFLIPFSLFLSYWVIKNLVIEIRNSSLHLVYSALIPLSFIFISLFEVFTSKISVQLCLIISMPLVNFSFLLPTVFLISLSCLHSLASSLVSLWSLTWLLCMAFHRFPSDQDLLLENIGIPFEEPYCSCFLHETGSPYVDSVYPV